jgi:hypothetical protein
MPFIGGSTSWRVVPDSEGGHEQAPDNADVMRAPQTFRERLDHIENATQQAVSALTQRAQNAAGALGTGAPAEMRGSAIRTAIEAAKKVAGALKTRLYDAVDPDDKLNLVFSPVRDAADKIVKSLDPLDEAPSGREASILADVRARPDVQPFKSLRALDRRVTTAMKEARRAGDDTVHRRLTILKGAVQSAIDDGVENQVAYENAAIERGIREVGDSITARIQDAWRSGTFTDGQADAGAMADRAGAGAPGEPGGGSLNASGAIRAESAPGRQSRPGSSRQGLSGEERSGAALGVSLPPAGSAPVRLIKFLAARGGLRPDSELRGIFAGENPFSPGVGKLIRKGGMTLDAARKAATEAGYIFDPGAESRGPLETDVNDLLDKIASDHQGDHQYPIGEQSDAYRHAMELRQTESTLRAELKGSGVNPNDVPRRIMNAAVDMISSGEEPNPHVAYERAVMQNSDSFGDEAGERVAQTGPIHGHDFSDDAYGAPPREFAPAPNEEGQSGNGGPTGRSGGQSRPGSADDRAEGEGGNAQPPLTPNFDQAAGGRLTKAKTYYKEDYAPTYKEGSVAKILAGPFSGKYDVLDSAVPSKAVLKGDKGYQVAKSFIKASNAAPEAIGAMADHTLDDLRSGLLPIGVVSPSKFAKWKADYGPALRAIDEQIPGFSNRFADAAKATDAMMEAGRLREEAIDQFQKGAAGQFLGNLGKNDPTEVENAVGKILSDKAAGPTRMESLVKAASKDPEAVAGLKKAGVDWMLREFSTTQEALDTGEKTLSSAKFQKFVSDNRATIQKLYGSYGLGMFAAVVHDLERANRVVAATNVRASPGSAKDVIPLLKKVGEAAASHTSLMVAMIEGGRLGFEHHGIIGAAGGAVAAGALPYLIGTMRAAGMGKANALVRDALLNPERARVYLSMMPASADSGRFLGLASSIRRHLIGTPINLRNAPKAQRQ